MKTLTEKEKVGLTYGQVPSWVNPKEMVPLAASTVRMVTEAELSNTFAFGELVDQRNLLEQTLKRTLPLEADVRKQIAPTLARVKREVDILSHTPEFGLPTIDPSFLSWKLNDGFPAFSVYSLESPLCSISYRDQIGMTMFPVLPPEMKVHYLDEKLEMMLQSQMAIRRLKDIKIQGRYTGDMPPSVREKIHYYIDPGTGAPRFDRILIVAEAPEWQVSGTPAPLRIGDPLVIGVKHGLLWFIDSYDLSPLESIVPRLCSSRSNLSAN